MPSATAAAGTATPHSPAARPMARLPAISVRSPRPGQPRDRRGGAAVTGAQRRDAGVAANSRPPPAASPAAASTAVCGPPTSSRPETRTGPRIVAAVKLTADSAYPVIRSPGSETRPAHRPRMLLGVAGIAAPPTAARHPESAGGPPAAVTRTKPTREPRQARLAVTSTAVWPRRSIRAPCMAMPTALPALSAAAMIPAPRNDPLCARARSKTASVSIPIGRPPPAKLAASGRSAPGARAARA